MEKFYFSRFTFSVRCKTTLLLPSYNGSTLRGGFGHAFRRIICAFKGKECTDCLLRHQCVYAYVFETPIPADAQIMRKYTAAPHPAISVSFITPTRMKYKNSLTKDLEFHIFFRSLLRRISLLSYFHCNHRIDDTGFKDLIQRARDIKTVKRSLYWHDWERYSNRQATRMKMGGFMGEITYEGDLREFWPYIRLGEYVHVGKGSSFGLGRYILSGKS